MGSVDLDMLRDQNPFAPLARNPRVDPPSSKNNKPKSAAAVKKKIEEHWPTLCEAAANNTQRQFQKFLQQVSKKAQVDETIILNFANPSEDALIHIAAKHGNADIVKLIVEKIPHLLRKKGCNGDTVWHIAAKTGKVIDQLFNFRNKSKESLVGCSHGKNRVKVTWENLSLRDTNEEENTALHEALINRRKSMAELLVSDDSDLSHYLNNEKKSALYLAAETGYKDTTKSMLKNGKLELQGKSIVHAAIIGKQKDVLNFLLEEELVFRNEDKWALHLAASIGFLEGIVYLFKKYSATERDENGLYPIHLASMNGYVEVIRELLQYCKAPEDLLTPDKQNVLHVAAKSGQHEVVSYILGTTGLDNLINMSDDHGNTPLHYATMNGHIRIVNTLAGDNRVHLNSKNAYGLTPIDAAEPNIKGISSSQQRLWQPFKEAAAKQASSVKIINAEGETSSTQSEPATTNYYKGTDITVLLLSTLFRIVYLVLGSTLQVVVYNNFNTDQATKISLLRNIKFHLFIFCTTIALSSFIVAAVAFIWAQLGNINNRVFCAHELAKALTGMAVTVTFLALLSGVYFVLGKVHWFLDIILTIGLVSLVSFKTHFSPL